jgi:E3 ubiquitin-protein ligase MYCBP2
LCAESLKDWCHNGYTDGWVLQYNQHLGKTLLVPLEEPKSIMSEILSDTVKKYQIYGQKPVTQSLQGTVYVLMLEMDLFWLFWLSMMNAPN